MANTRSRLLEEEMRREAEAALERVREVREIEREFHAQTGVRSAKRALEAVRRLGWTRPRRRKYPSDHNLLLDYAVLRRKDLDHRSAAEELRRRYGADTADAVTAALQKARTTLRRELNHWSALPPDAPGGEPEIDDPEIGYSGPAPAGEQASFLRGLLDATRGIPRR